MPPALQRAMAAEAEASREARAKVIAAEGEMKASRALKEASDVMSQSPAALQVSSFVNIYWFNYNVMLTIIYVFLAEISANVEQHCVGKEFDHYFPVADGADARFYAATRIGTVVSPQNNEPIKCYN